MRGEPEAIFLYDTTLRDGAQRKGLSFSLSDKLRLTSRLDAFGIDFIEGGWPGSNPKDAEYFARVRELDLQHAKIAAFGSTRRSGVQVSGDPQLRALLAAQTPVVTLVGKSSRLHVEMVLRASRTENLAMIRDSVALCKDAGRYVVFDAEHFFDGLAEDAEFTLECLRAAAEAGADTLCLCDTNGGSLPQQVHAAVSLVKAQYWPSAIGVHTHNDSELAVANALAAVQAGATQVQGTINGYGERCGNANLVSLMPTLALKLQRRFYAAAHLSQLTALSRESAEMANIAPDPFAAYVGANAFTHKGGIHASAVARLARSYEHVPPQAVGNHNEIVVSELAGLSNLRTRCTQLNLHVADEAALLADIKALESQGLHLEAADASFELLLRRRDPAYRRPFELIEFRVEARRSGSTTLACQATCKTRIGAATLLTVAEAAGPVAAIDAAMRAALQPFWPGLESMRLTDYSVRILDPEAATGATTRVLIEAAVGAQRWSSVGASNNIIEASAQALTDSFEQFIAKFSAANSNNSMIHKETQHGYTAA